MAPVPREKEGELHTPPGLWLLLRNSLDTGASWCPQLLELENHPHIPEQKQRLGLLKLAPQRLVNTPLTPELPLASDSFQPWGLAPSGSRNTPFSLSFCSRKGTFSSCHVPSPRLPWKQAQLNFNSLTSSVLFFLDPASGQRCLLNQGALLPFLFSFLREFVLVCQGYCNTALQTEWLRQQGFIFSQFWWPVSEVQVSAGPSSL